MLKQYALDNGFENCEYFIDDGYSGTNYDRPDFSRLLDMIEHNMVCTLVVKDLSRLGREYLKTGYYTEIVFPMHDVRFIAINDGVDSINGDNEFAPFKNIINEWYAKDISKKIKSSIRTRVTRGEFVNGKPPYGYMRDPEKRNHLIPDENIAPAVKMLFKLASEGKSCYAIALIMKKEEYPKPSAYIPDKNGNYRIDSDCEHPYEWSARSVKGILTNVTYIGHLYAGMRTHRSFKDKTIIKLPEDKWIKRMNDHEPLVDDDTFFRVQEYIKSRQRTRKKTADANTYRGLMKCGDCGQWMGFTSRTDRSSIGFYTCGKYKLKGVNKGCTPHYIKIEQLNELMVGEIVRISSEVREDKENFINELVEAFRNETEKKIAEYHRKLDKCLKRRKELDVLTRRVYEDHVFGKISDDMYSMLSISYEEEICKLEKRISEIDVSLKENKGIDNHMNVCSFTDLMEGYVDITEINAEIVHNVIDRIIVHEKEFINGAMGMRVEVYYRYVGKIFNTNGSDLMAPEIGWHGKRKCNGA